MHSAVMQNKKYIEFAKDSSVEVLALGRLDEAVQKKEKNAVAYKAKGPDGKDAVYMLHWPNLTLDEILALARSQAAQYNKTGGIPYTCLVDPWTLLEVERLGSSSKSIMESAEAYKKRLQKEKGKGLARKDLEKLADVEAKLPRLLEAKDYAKASEALDKASPKEVPEALKVRLSAARESIVTAAQAELDALKTLAATDAAKAKKDLAGLLGRLRGTGLEESAKELMKSLSAGASGN